MTMTTFMIHDHVDFTDHVYQDGGSDLDYAGRGNVGDSENVHVFVRFSW